MIGLEIIGSKGTRKIPTNFNPLKVFQAEYDLNAMLKHLANFSTTFPKNEDKSKNLGIPNNIYIFKFFASIRNLYSVVTETI